MIAIKNVYLKIKKSQILKNINLEVNDGECFAILGPNGAGKSSLVEILTDIIRPTEGKITIFGKSFQQVKSNIGVVYEKSSMLHFLKIKELLAYVCKYYNKRYSDISGLIENLGLKEIENNFINKLSKGERQKIGIVIALIHNPQILILDEPTSGMDPFFRENVWKLFKNRKRIIVLTTHIWEEAEKYCDRIAFINKGEIIKTATPHQFIEDAQVYGQNRIVVDKNEKLMPYLQNTHYIEENNSFYIYSSNSSGFINKILENGVRYTQSPVTLEDAFLHLTHEIN